MRIDQQNISIIGETMRTGKKEVSKHLGKINFFQLLFLCFGRQRNVNQSSLVSPYLFSKVMNGKRPLNRFSLR